MREYYKRPHAAAARKAYRERNKERRYAQTREWRAQNAERLRAYRQRPEVKQAARQRKPHLNRDPLKHREHERRRTARKLQNTFERVDYNAVFDAAKGMCGICKKPITDGNFHFDHITPLAKGGSHTVKNLQLAHALCNLQKNVKLPEAA